MVFLIVINIIMLIALVAIFIDGRIADGFHQYTAKRFNDVDREIKATNNSVTNNTEAIVKEISYLHTKFSSLDAHCSDTYKEIVNIHSYITELEVKFTNSAKDISKCIAKITDSVSAVKSISKFEDTKDIITSNNIGIKGILKDCERLESYIGEISSQISQLQENVLKSIEKTKTRKSSSNTKRVTTTDEIPKIE